MVKITELAHGYTLYGDPDTGHPLIKTPKGGVITPMKVATDEPSIEARGVFRALRRYLSQKDVEWKCPDSEIRWKAADLATFAMETWLKACGRWSDDLRVVEEAA